MQVRLIPIASGDEQTAPLVLVRGYLNQGEGKRRDEWLAAIRAGGFTGQVLELRWDASTRLRFTTNVIGFRDWRATKSRAQVVGDTLLPPLLNQLAGQGVTLVGASAGARIVYHALLSGALSAGKVRDAWLLGAALGRDTNKDWSKAASTLSGRLLNVYSRKDVVLATLYRAASRGRVACGTGPIDSNHPQVVNIDATELLRGGPLYLATHGRYATALGRRGALCA